MSESKLDVTVISPQAYARAPWNKFHWRITRAGRPGQSLEGCCAIATREGRTCVGFGSRKEAVESGSAKRAELFESGQSLSQAG
jgi:hypothetical protein